MQPDLDAQYKDARGRVLSPLTLLDAVVLERRIDAETLIGEYRRQLNVDVSRFFVGVDEVRVYRCSHTGVRFYDPPYMVGDSALYETLQQFEWYYRPWKWEHRIASRYVRKGDRVLELGCGTGEWLEGVTRERGAKCHGLEFNKAAIVDARARGMAVTGESVEEHARGNGERYDVVCGFQVIEHVPAVGRFLRATVDVLKPGGYLIVSVPNNESFVGMDTWHVLDMPPHHQSLWDRNALGAIGVLLKVQLRKMHCEPLQTYQVETYWRIQRERATALKGLRGRVLAGLMWRIEARLGLLPIRMVRRFLRGHTIVAIYRKP